MVNSIDQNLTQNCNTLKACSLACKSTSVKQEGEYDQNIQIKPSIPAPIDPSLKTLIDIFTKSLNSAQKLDLLKIAESMCSQNVENAPKSHVVDSNRQFRVLKPDEDLFHQSQPEESKADIPNEYEIVIRHADDEAADLVDESDQNKIQVYKNALKDVCQENDFLRAEILESKRKTEQLKLENDDMKEVIYELSESINYMTHKE